MPSTVLTRWPAQARPSTRQDSTGVPSTRTVQVPHSPSSQPCLVPVSPRSSRSTSSSVLWGAKATSTGSPLSSSAIFALASAMVPKRNLDNSVVRRQLSAPISASVTYGGGLADRRKGGRKNGVGARGLAVRQSARPSVSAGLPRPGRPHSQDRPLDRWPQRHSRRDSCARRARLRGLRRAPAEAHERHPEAPRGRGRGAVLGGLRARPDDRFPAPPG